MTETFRMQGVSGFEGGATSEPEVACAMREFMEETASAASQCIASRSAIAKSFWAATASRIDTSTTSSPWTHAAYQSGTTTESQAREINCACWMTYEDAQQAEEFRNTSGGPTAPTRKSSCSWVVASKTA
jgi:hypothetical protein